MDQKFNIPVYLVLCKYGYDGSENDVTMLGYSFIKENALDLLKLRSHIFANEHKLEAVVPDWWTGGETLWEVGDYVFQLEERSIEV